MTVAEVVRKMVEYSKGDLHDINHFMKVYAYAKTIGEGRKSIGFRLHWFEPNTAHY